MNEALPTMHAASVDGVTGRSTLCGLTPKEGQDLWMGEWFLVTCTDCLTLGAHSMDASNE